MNSADPGAHGAFDGMAKASSGQWWASRHRLTLLGGALAGAAVAGAALARRG